MPSLRGFLKDLGSDAPSPGGGSAAALTAALGLALVEMVARLNARRYRKKGEMSSAKEADKTAGAAQALRRQMEGLIAKDAAAFKKISRQAKENPARQKALKEGAAVPFRICEGVVAGLEQGLREKNRTSRWLASDLVEAVILLLAAFHAAKLNVNANLWEITDKKFTLSVETKLKMLEARTAVLAQTLRGSQPSPNPS